MRDIYKFLAVSTLTIGMAAPVLAVDVKDKREEVRQQQRDVTEERKDVMEEKQDVTEARRDLRQDVAQTHRAKKVIGMNVKNPQGEALGEIHDLVLNFDNGHIAYVVISSGGLLGMGDTLRAVPWKALHLNSQADGFVLNIDKTAWTKAPSFKDNDWPEVTDREWNRQLESYYR